jgi:hypothetical protein
LLAADQSNNHAVDRTIVEHVTGHRASVAVSASVHATTFDVIVRDLE